ncbi:hypothetical protein ACTFIT_005330 [Dictyostelium discoideum]
MSSQEGDLPPLSDYPDATKVDELWCKIIAQSTTPLEITNLLNQFSHFLKPCQVNSLSKNPQTKKLLEHLEKCRGPCNNDNTNNLLSDMIQNVQNLIILLMIP